MLRLTFATMVTLYAPSAFNNVACSQLICSVGDLYPEENPAEEERLLEESLNSLSQFKRCHQGRITPSNKMEMDLQGEFTGLKTDNSAWLCQLNNHYRGRSTTAATIMACYPLDHHHYHDHSTPLLLPPSPLAITTIHDHH